MSETAARRRALLRGLLAGCVPSGIGWDALAAGAATPVPKPLPALPLHLSASSVATRAIPKTGEKVPLVGLGSWITFNVGDDRAARAACADVMRAFFEAGGRIIDSSPMYGSSQAVIGDGLARLGGAAPVFSADKVWIGSGARGPAQIEASRRLWRVPRFDLLQVHNLLAWEEHLPLLLEMKAAGRLRHVGITTSEGRRHREIEAIMRTQPIDFVQLSYNLLDRDVEQRLLPLAASAASPSSSTGRSARATCCGAAAPSAAGVGGGEVGCDGWAQFALKFVVSHPAVTCAIPATTQRRACAAEHGRCTRPPARRGAAPAHGGACRGAVIGCRAGDARLGDVPPVGLPAVLAAHLLAAVRALQRGPVAGAPCRAGRRARDRGDRPASRPLGGACGAGDARRLLGVDRLGVPLQRYASINWAAAWFAAGFAVEALLLIGAAGLGARLQLCSVQEPRGAIGFGLLVYALLVHPSLGVLLGRPWQQAEVFGLAPDPTTVATLGVLLLLRGADGGAGTAPKIAAWLLWPLPVLWCLVSGATLWTMGSAGAPLLPLAAVIALAAAWHGARARKAAQRSD